MYNKTITFLTLGIFVCILGMFLFLGEERDEPQKHIQNSGTQQLNVKAKAWGIYDTVSGTEIISHNAHARLPIASLTKLMTADVVVRNYDLEATTTITDDIVRTEGRAGRLKAGDELTLRELLFPLLLESSNDAAKAFSSVPSEVLLVNRMNTYARELNLVNTTFADASGLSGNNTSSVEDLARFITNIKHTNHYILDISRLDNYLTKHHTWKNNSHIYTEDGYHGGKHGYIPEAGRTLVSVFIETLKNGEKREITYVLLNSEESEKELARMRRYVEGNVAYE